MFLSLRKVNLGLDKNMITTKTKETGTWTDYINPGSYKTAFLNAYENKPPKLSEFILIGYEDALRNKTLTMSLMTRTLPEKLSDIWGGLNVGAVRIELQVRNYVFYAVSCWYSPEETVEARNMKDITKEAPLPGKVSMTAVSGAITCTGTDIALIKFVPLLGIPKHEERRPELADSYRSSF